MKNKINIKSIIGLLFIAFIIMMIIFFICKNPLEGRWSMDDITIYEFYENDKGAMILPSTEYEFLYTIKDNYLYIDFTYDGAKDAKYLFEVQGDTLILEGGNETTKGTYTLRKDE